MNYFLTNNMETWYVVNDEKKEIVSYQFRNAKDSDSFLVKLITLPVSFIQGMIGAAKAVRKTDCLTHDKEIRIEDTSFPLQTYIAEGYTVIQA